jgi:putative FmdB family regulatory protein
MPTYDYRCEACGHAFEEFQSITADPLKTCPECSKDQLRRLIGTGAGIIFKGSGFYETDYRSKEYKDKAKAEQKGSSDGQGGGDASGSSESSSKTEGSGGSANGGSSGDSKSSESSANN